MLDIKTNRLLLNLIKTILVLFSSFSVAYAYDVPKRIAHAGGAYKGMTYTDSINALDSNVNSFELFELDFNLTSDDKIVCIHDWEHSVPRTFGYDFNSVPSFSLFKYRAKNNINYENCNIDTLSEWLRANPGKRVITDVKDNNFKVLGIIADGYPELVDKFIPQIYHSNEYDSVMALGFKDIIFTTYGYSGSDADVFQFSKTHKLYALTIPRSRVNGFAHFIQELSMPVYTHTINDCKDFHDLINIGLAGVYTDFISSDMCNE